MIVRELTAADANHAKLLDACEAEQETAQRVRRQETEFDLIAGIAAFTKTARSTVHNRQF